MCLDEYGLRFDICDGLVKEKKDLCNKDLAINRGLVCHALNAYKSSAINTTVNCLEGNSSCGLMGMLWKKYLNKNIKIQINGMFPHSLNVIKTNLERNKLNVEVSNEDPCILVRKNSYDFIFLNCKTSASHFLDSVFSKVKNNGIVVITTSEDPSLYWQSPNVALRNYGGTIVRTYYFRELGIRLVLAEMARAAARYLKGITVLCTTSFKAQQSFTIMVKVEKGAQHAAECLKKIQRLLHCSVCEDRAFIPNSEFVFDSLSSFLSCDCSKNPESKIVNELGPIWSGDIFSADFVESMLSHCDGFPWEHSVKLLLLQLLEEARCSDGNSCLGIEPDSKKAKFEESSSEGSLNNSKEMKISQPCFYISTHKHHPSNQQLQKLSSIICILKRKGFRASRTHFDPKAVRTNASLREYIQTIEQLT